MCVDGFNHFVRGFLINTSTRSKSLRGTDAARFARKLALALHQGSFVVTSGARKHAATCYFLFDLVDS